MRRHSVLSAAVLVILAAFGLSACGAVSAAKAPATSSAASSALAPLVTETWQPRAQRTADGWRVSGLGSQAVAGTPTVRGDQLVWNSIGRVFLMDLRSGAIRVVADAGPYPRDQAIALVAQPDVSAQFVVWARFALGLPLRARVMALDLSNGTRRLLASSADSPALSGATAVWLAAGPVTPQGREDPLMSARLPGGAASTVLVAVDPFKLTVSGRLLAWLQRHRTSDGTRTSFAQSGEVRDLVSGRVWHFHPVGQVGDGGISAVEIVGGSVVWYQEPSEGGSSEIWTEELASGALRRLGVGSPGGLLSPLGPEARWWTVDSAGTTHIYGARLPSGPRRLLLSGDPKGADMLSGPYGGGRWVVWETRRGSHSGLAIRRLGPQ